jgi:hypothetical protein
MTLALRWLRPKLLADDRSTKSQLSAAGDTAWAMDEPR